MKLIINNTYWNISKFVSFQEAQFFISQHKTEQRLHLTDTSGEYCYVYRSLHSLTQKCLSMIIFYCDEECLDSHLLVWDNTLIFNTGVELFVTNDKLDIKARLIISTPLVGLYVINKDRVLVLEEAYMRIVDSVGKVIKSQLFDLMQDFDIKPDSVEIKTEEEVILIPFA